MELNAVLERKVKLVDIYSTFLGILNPEEQLVTKERIQPFIDQMLIGEFQIVVMGEIKKGKSSFISALLGEYDLLPTDSDVATSTVYKIKYGPEPKYTVVFNQELSEKEPQEITQEQIPEYGTEKGNPFNKERVAFIQVELPNPVLKHGLLIVDTPGVGGLFRQHRAITFEYAPSANAVFFVVDSVETLINEQEVKFLKDLYKITKHIYFVQTKIDAVDTDIWQSWKERNLEILSHSNELEEFDLSKEKIKYFPVSAQLKRFADEEPESDDAEDDLEDSGFIELSDFINNQLIGEQKSILVAKGMNHLKDELEYATNIARERIENLDDTTKKNLADKETKIEKILNELEKWKSESWDKVGSDFAFKLSQQTKNSRQRIRKELSPSEYNFTQKIDEIREQYDSISTLTDQADEIVNNHVSTCAEVGKNVIVEYLSKVERAFYEVSQKALSDLEHITKFGSISLSRTSLDIDKSFSYSGAAVDAAAGGIVGGAVAGGMWWALVGATHAAFIAVPGGGLVIAAAAAAGPLGWAAIGAVGILSAVGAGWGANKLREKRKIKEVINLIKLKMEKISNNSIDNFDHYIEKLEEEIKLGSSRLFEKVGDQSRQEAEAMLTDLKKTKQFTEQEASEEMKIRKKYLDELVALRDQLSRLSQTTV